MATHALLEETTAGEIQGNSHFIRAVTEMANHSSVVTGQAIYTDKGLKLVDKRGCGLTAAFMTDWSSTGCVIPSTRN